MPGYWVLGAEDHLSAELARYCIFSIEDAEATEADCALIDRYLAVESRK